MDQTVEKSSRLNLLLKLLPRDLVLFLMNMRKNLHL